MKEDPHDNPIRQRFDECKRHDAGQTPSFVTFWHRAQSHGDAGRGAVPWFRFAVVTAGITAAVLGAGILLRRGASERPAAEPYALALSEWESPTRALLQIPGQQFLSSVPQLDSSTWEALSTMPDTETIN